MRREETEGASLREVSVKVALEQWTERTEDTVSVVFNAVSALEGSGIGEENGLRSIFPYRQSAESSLFEVRW